ncbi:MAG TPA: MBL fold metallo-hydrolase [Methanomassiliicoccales archaeon]|nr:MBL fold metallo-hydrolase [Methanomassiliicoccales archaeon]
MSGIKVHTVCDGSILRQGRAILEAHSSCTLVIGERMIVVDTSDHNYRPRVIDGMKRLGIDPSQVDILVNTHLHSDHCANNDLFPNAKMVAHQLERPGPSYWAMAGEELRLMDGVRAVHTPGHCPGAISVFVDSDVRVAMAGDAIPTIDNYRKMAPPGVTSDPEQAMDSMRRILAWAQVVVPGHDRPFKVDD